MSLPARQQRKLREIEGGLTGSDPRWRSLFGIFTRLTTGEAMPWFEAVPTRPVADTLAAFRSLIRRIARRPASRVRALLLLPAALSAMVCGIMMAVGRRNRSSFAADGAAGIPWVLGGLTLGVIAAAVVSFFAL